MNVRQALEEVKAGKVVRRKSTESMEFIVVWEDQTGALRRDEFGPAYFDWAPDPASEIKTRTTGNTGFTKDCVLCEEWEVVMSRGEQAKW